MSSENDLLPRIEISPATKPIGSVIILHGLGADGNDFVTIVPELKLPDDLPLKFIFPNAPVMPVTINNGYVMPAWYDIMHANIIERTDKPGLMASVEKVMDLIAHEVQLGIPPEKIILGGFSQGAVVALAAGLHCAKPLGGILALSGYLPYAEQMISQSSAHARETPIFMAHGKEDFVVPYPLGQIAFDALKKAGFAASWQSYPIGHTVCSEEIQEISSWLQTIYT